MANGAALRNKGAASSCLLDEEVVGIAVAPLLPRFERPNGRVSGSPVVLRGVGVLGVVAATYVAAGKAEAQMHPPVARGEALLAPLWSVGAAISRTLEVIAKVGHELDTTAAASR